MFIWFEILGLYVLHIPEPDREYLVKELENLGNRKEHLQSE